MKTSPAHPSSATLLFVVILRLLSSSASHALSSSSSVAAAGDSPPLLAWRPNRPVPSPPRRPDWSAADRSLRDPSVCVVSPVGLDDVLAALRGALCGDDAHADLDLRMRVRCPRGGDDDDDEDDDDDDDLSTTLEDCARIIDAVAAGDGRLRHPPPMTDGGGGGGGSPRRPRASSSAATSALAELARGVSSLADASFAGGPPPDVHVRAVIASDYRAIDPSFHTDKCPLRAYVTLSGPGTEYVGSACRPWEYAALRALGAGAYDGAGLPLLPPPMLHRAREAGEMELIVMKGDRYVHPRGSSSSSSPLWSRSSACVHRSPPGGGGRRVVLSLDLANGEDEREWYEAGRKRGWRSGMTQRKSRLVS
jgi:hypothetical protein